MAISKLLGRGRAPKPANRYAVVADGGDDPERVREPDAQPATDAADARVDTVAPPGPPTVAAGLADSTSADIDLGSPAPGPEELERRRVALDELLDLMRPAVQMDGGDLALVDADYATGVVEVELRGACGSCAISATTLQGGVERLLTERLEWVTEVVGGVDDSVDPFESAAMGRGAYVPRYY